MIIPILRADVALSETYAFVPELPLDCAITAFGGLNDDLTLAMGSKPGGNRRTVRSGAHAAGQSLLHQHGSAAAPARPSGRPGGTHEQAGLKRDLVTEGVAGWASPPGDLELLEGEVHVWRASLEGAAGQIAAMAETLSVDERSRAGKFYFERDRRSFILTRGILRTLLGRYLGQTAGRLRFCYGPQGKPALTQDSGGDTLRFNLSHSHGMALFALARARDVGVDLEWIRPDLASEEIAERFFAPREVSMLRKVPVQMRVEAFFHCWTRKEAYIKATGKGLSMPLEEFVVSLAPDEPAALLETRTDHREASRWCLRSLAPHPGYVGALAVRGDGLALRCWHWPADPPLEPPDRACAGTGQAAGAAARLSELRSPAQEKITAGQDRRILVS